MPRWLKYNSGPITAARLVDRKQDSDPYLFQKPFGFWITDDGEDCWRSWCLDNRFGLDRLTHKHEIFLDESRLLILRSEEEVREFSHRFGIIFFIGDFHAHGIDWRDVARAHSGVIIAPYQHRLRFDNEYRWYWGWDCASGCIWDADAIRDIRLVEVDLDVASQAVPAWHEKE